MMYFQGGVALSPHRQLACLRRLQHICPSVSAVESYFDFLVETNQPLSATHMQVLLALLPDARLSAVPDVDREQFWVSARLGTLSPFASKATDIAAICGLESVTRIERLQRYHLHGAPDDVLLLSKLQQALYDPLTESVLKDAQAFSDVFRHTTAQPLEIIPLLKEGKAALTAADQRLGLALSEEDGVYLLQAYRALGRDPTDAELMMFAQVNSEHCRHKIFNAQWQIDGHPQTLSLFKMIKHTFAQHPQSVEIAYNDNAAVMHGHIADRFMPDAQTHTYGYHTEPADYVLKVETHNHPTAISPLAGAATGSGGEIRDEAATGRGGEPKAGLCGFSVSHLRIPGFPQPWEETRPLPSHLASALDIMLQGPIGAALFNNEFGRPNVLGYFRSFEMQDRAYHKPIMLAGGIGQIRTVNTHKKPVKAGDLLLVLGGPALAIGLGGGAASSRQGESEQQALDFASVQRANPEMQRRAQEVISTCVRLGEHNPIISIHDVGAGGLSNALPELVHADHLGAKFDLRAIPSDEPGMSPREIWCNESQERYVLAIGKEHLTAFAEIAKRERCPFAVLGYATEEPRLLVHDRLHTTPEVVDLPMATLFEDMPVMQRADHSRVPTPCAFALDARELSEAIERVLQFPCVASKSFLITIGDRSVGGLIARDQLVGPYQVPVADCAVTANSFTGYAGEAMSLGERAPLALLNPAASARMALGEAITNLAAATVDDLGDVVLSANWMAAMHLPGEGAALYAAVKALAMELCPTLKIAIPVGKDSLSMQVVWRQDGQAHTVASPLSLVVTAAAKVSDIRKTLTPELQTDQGDTQLLFIDLGRGDQALGGSVLGQTYQTLGESTPDLTEPRLLARFFDAIQALNRAGLLLAYHDRSDGGLLATVCEMMFAGHVGVSLTLDALGENVIAGLFNENLGAVLQVKTSEIPQVLTHLHGFDLADCTHVLGVLNSDDELKLYHQQRCIYQKPRQALYQVWQTTSYRMQALRDNPALAAQEFEHKGSPITALRAKVNFTYAAQPATRAHRGLAPRVAILREQGVNGHVEMAAAFDRVGFQSVDVHMSDLLAGRVRLRDFQGLAACGGFSYGDVLGAGRGWAQSILLHAAVREEFAAFFARPETFSLGICNGCQMMAYLRELIPGAHHWPYFTRNLSEQFEARLTLVEIMPSPSILFREMAGSVLPVVVSHGEGRVQFARPYDTQQVLDQQLVALRYVDGDHQMTELYPMNPNGSAFGMTALTSVDGRATIMMPHPERVFRTNQLSWHPKAWGENSPWVQLFQNAYDFVVK